MPESLNDYMDHSYPVEMRAIGRVEQTPLESGGLPIRRLKRQSQIWAVQIRGYVQNATEATALETLCRQTVADGATLLNWTHPISGVTYSAILDPRNPIVSSLVGLNRFEFDIQLLAAEP